MGGLPLSAAYARIYAAVKKIPRGRVATYGQIARLAGLTRSARHVGTALGSLPDGAAIPWHRVVNAKGEISARDYPDAVAHQRELLEREKVAFDARGRIPLERFLWRA